MGTFSLNQLSEGIRERHLGTQNKRLTEKWSRTGLLRGLDGVHRENMARLLENQAAQVLREASSLSDGAGGSSGDIRGFTNVAFPIVRRVFGGLVANELVSIQPMSLPSGLLFYLDYTYGNNVGGAAPGANLAGGTAYASGSSIYNNPVGKGVQSGSLATGGQYDLVGTGYSRFQGKSTLVATDVAKATQIFAFKGTSAPIYANNADWIADAGEVMAHATGTDGKLLQFDPQITSLIESGERYFFIAVPFNTARFTNADPTMIKEYGLTFVAGKQGDTTLSRIPEAVQSGMLLNIRRLNQLIIKDGDNISPAPLAVPGVGGTGNAHILFVVKGDGAINDLDVDIAADDNSNFQVSFPEASRFSVGQGDSLVIPTFESGLGAGGTNPNDPATAPVIPEIDIKIESLAVTAQTRKLKARWSPELAQDLNAYHSLDAEVELTQILSEQIALELDREVLNDLLTQANGANYYWSRAPGRFVNKETGVEATRASSLHPGPAFTGTVREWYETLVETIIDVANTIHRKTLRGSANFIVVGPDVATILESSVFYKPSYTIDGEGQVSSPMTLGTEKIGTVSNRFTVYKDPYFPRNKILVGYKGGSYLETGYVYAPYVPLIVTPTIFAPEDFTPRKGVMTRYGKKMVRSDFYGTVTLLDMNII